MRPRLLMLVAVALLSASTVFCQEKRFNNSLEFVPQDAAVYFATMNHEKLWSQFSESAALKALQDSPVNKKMRSAYRKRSRGFDQLGENPFRYYLEGYANTIDSIPGKAVMAYVQRIFKNELMVYADESWVDLQEALVNINREFVDLFAELELDDTEEIQEALELLLMENLGDLECPTLLFGALLDDPADFTSLIDVAESFVKEFMSEIDEEVGGLSDYYRSESQPGHRYIALVAKGSDIPWEAFEEVMEDDENTYLLMRIIQELLNDKGVAVCLSVKNNVLSFSIGPSLDHVTKLGDSPKLIDNAAMKPIKDALEAGKILHQVHYINQRLTEIALESTLDGVSGIPLILLTALEEAADDLISEQEWDELVTDLDRDVEELREDLRRYYGQAGASVGYIAAATEGLEGFYFNDAPNPVLDSSNPMALAQNVGANPILFTLAREKADRFQYQALRKWTGRVLEYTDRLAPYFFEDEVEYEQFSVFMGILRPALKKMDEITAKKFAPNVFGREAGFVVGVSEAKQSWSPAMPASHQPLSIPIPAMISQVGDETAVKESVVEYQAAVMELIKRINAQSEPDGLFEQITLQEFARKEVNGGESFTWALPDGSYLDSSLGPHVSIANGVMVIGIHAASEQRLLATGTTSLFGPAADNKPAMAIGFFDNRLAVNLLEQWADYGFEQWANLDGGIQLSSNGATQDLTMNEQDIRESTKRLMDFFRCFHGVSSRRYEEDGKQINHFLLKFSDLESPDSP